MGTFGQQQICHNAQIGISIEPEINARLQVPATTVSTDIIFSLAIFKISNMTAHFSGCELLHDFRTKDVGKLCQFCHQFCYNAKRNAANSGSEFRAPQHCPDMASEFRKEITTESKFLEIVNLRLKLYDKC